MPAFPRSSITLRVLGLRCLAAAMAGAFLVLSQPATSRAAVVEYCNKAYLGNAGVFGWCLALLKIDKFTGNAGQSRANVSPASGTILTANNGADLEAGEPTLGGLMQATVWRRFKPTRSGKVVINTFGSDIDTVLAAYTGSAINALTLVRSNDDKNIAGFQTGRSLIAFDAVANTTYLIQAGGKSNAQGSIVMNLHQFPAIGGLSAELLAQDGFAFRNGDYVCRLGSGGTSNCATATFVLYNSSGRTLTVTPSSNLGPGVVSPPPFNLPANAVIAKTFTFSGFDTSTVRSKIGKFIFSGSDGLGFNSVASHKAVVTVKAAVQPAKVSMLSSPQMRTGRLNTGQLFRVSLRNTSAATAIGCHFRPNDSGQFYTDFQQVNPATGAAIGNPNAAFNLAPGGTLHFDVDVASRQSYEGDPRFAGPVVTDCANAPPPISNLKSNFDITARDLFNPAEIIGTPIVPTSDTLNVPAGGQSSFRFSTVNYGPTADLTAQAVYARPFTDSNPNQWFGSTICRTQTATSSCIAPAAASVTYTATKGATAFFRMFVTAPSVDPGYSPRLRRVYAFFKQPPPDNFGSYLVGVHSIAVRRK